MPHGLPFTRVYRPSHLSTVINASDIATSVQKDGDKEGTLADDPEHTAENRHNSRDMDPIPHIPPRQIQPIQESYKSVSPISSGPLPPRGGSGEPPSAALQSQIFIKRNHSLLGGDFMPIRNYGTLPWPIDTGDLKVRPTCLMMNCDIHDSGRSPRLVLTLCAVDLYCRIVERLEFMSARETDARRWLALEGVKDFMRAEGAKRVEQARLLDAMGL